MQFEQDKYRLMTKALQEQGLRPESFVNNLERVFNEVSDILNLHQFVESFKKPGAKDFSNVPNNAFLKASVAYILAHLVGLNNERKREVARASAVPNLDLHLNKFPQDFEEGHLEILRKMSEVLQYDKKLARAAGADFFTSGRARERDVTVEERLMVLASDLVEERQPGELRIVDPIKHIDDFKREDRDDLGEAYWDAEKNFNLVTIKELFNGLNPQMLPTLILDKLGDFA